MSLRLILTCIVSLAVIALIRPAVEAAPTAESAPLLYTAAPKYDALAWMQGADRFPAGATIFVRDGAVQRPLLPAFFVSADASVSFDGQRVLFAGKAKSQDPWQIWEIQVAGGGPRRITSGPDDCIRPFYLPEDRVVYARKTAGRFVIEAANLSGGKPLALTHGPANFLPADVLRDGRILFEASNPLGSDAAPEIYTVYSDGSGVESYRCDHGKPRHHARQVSSGDIVFVSRQALARFTSARAHEVPIAAPPGEFAGDVAETSSGEWLIPWRAKNSDSFELVSWTPGETKLHPVVQQEGSNVLQPALLSPRTVPNRHPSALHDWPNANLLCLNAYTSKHSFPRDSIHSVRVYARDNAGAAKLLGTAPVERDGSFFVQVPNDQPLQIELLDASGKTVKRESGFFWVRRGEQRVCVGCHAGPETAPENAVPMTLLKSTTPSDLTGTAAPSAAGGH